MPIYEEEIASMLEVVRKAKSYGLIDSLQEAVYRASINRLFQDYQNVQESIKKLEEKIIEYQSEHRG
jgi:hypothetical protein